MEQAKMLIGRNALRHLADGSLSGCCIAISRAEELTGLFGLSPSREMSSGWLGV
jgi:hypothetical protein